MANVVSSTLPKPFFLQVDAGDGTAPIYYTASDMRRFFTGIVPRSGILGSSHFLVTQADNVGMAIKVNAGFANVGGDYLVRMLQDQTISLSGFTGNPTATRTHKVFLSVYDGLEKSGTGYDARIDVVEDTGAGANPPANATAYLQLATLSVAPSQGNIQNANINNTVRHGGVASEYVYLDPYLASGFTSAGAAIDSEEIRARYENGRVFLGGALGRSAGAFAAGTTYTIGTMHSNLRPARTRFLLGTTSDGGAAGKSGTYTFRLRIDKDGTMRATLPDGNTPSYLMFDGLSYDLD